VNSLFLFLDWECRDVNIPFSEILLARHDRAILKTDVILFFLKPACFNIPSRPDVPQNYIMLQITVRL